MSSRIEEIFNESYNRLSARTDKVFGWILLFQWFLAVVLALNYSPKTWEAGESSVHIHVWAALFLGGCLTVYPVFLVFKSPGKISNRYFVTAAQMAYSMILIHITGGRIETHFHIFGSLAFLAFYRDFKPLLLATFLTACDHLFRGYFWPMSVYGVLSASPWRAIEHAAWVLFEDFFLFISIKGGLQELKVIAEKQVNLEIILRNVEKRVEERTLELKKSQQTIIEQQQALVSAAKLSSLGEMAGGIAHEINTPLAIISLKVDQMHKYLKEGSHAPQSLQDSLGIIKKTTNRIANTINGLRTFARDGRDAVVSIIKVSAVVDDTLGLCQEKFKNNGIDLILKKNSTYENCCFYGRPIEISQVLLNLMNNAFDAVVDLDQKWVKIEASEKENMIEISVTDSGGGIALDIQEKMMQPFFTTKEIGKGTGLGLSISKGIVDAHNGKLFLDRDCKNTKFILLLPKAYEEPKIAAS